MTKAETVKGLPGIRAYRWIVEEELFGNWNIPIGPPKGGLRLHTDKEWIEAMEKETVKICRKRAHSIRIRHRRGTTPRETAADLARWNKLASLERGGVKTCRENP